MLGIHSLVKIASTYRPFITNISHIHWAHWNNMQLSKNERDMNDVYVVICIGIYVVDARIPVGIRSTRTGEEYLIYYDDIYETNEGLNENDNRFY